MKSLLKFIKECSKLSSLIKDEDEDEALLNEILNFKNEVRAACLPANEKALKGPCSFKKVVLKKKDQEALRIELKKIREFALKKHFKSRLAKDEKRLKLLKEKWETLKAGKTDAETQFVESQLNRMDKKHKEGKPLSLPKWYHCTRSADIQKLILESGVLYSDEILGGAFVGNYPVYSYVKFGLTFSSYVEKTATNDPVDGIVYPSCTNSEFLHAIHFGDEEQPAEPSQPTLWIGFQRGKNARDGEKIGIPLFRKKIVESDQALDYFKYTSISFIFNSKDETHASKDFALANRVQLLNNDQEKALRELISATFALTLPIDWEGNVF